MICTSKEPPSFLCQSSHCYAIQLTVWQSKNYHFLCGKCGARGIEPRLQLPFYLTDAIFSLSQCILIESNTNLISGANNEMENKSFELFAKSIRFM